jgi:hypothetical protein
MAVPAGWLLLTLAAALLCFAGCGEETTGPGGDDDDSSGEPVLLGPSDLEATLLDTGTVALAWTDNDTAELGFVVERRVGGEEYQELLRLPADAEEHNDSAFTFGLLHRYRVRSYAQDDTGEVLSEPSLEDSARAFWAGPVGDEDADGRSVADGNRVWTGIYADGFSGDALNSPSFEWPGGTGNIYVGDLTPVVALRWGQEDSIISAPHPATIRSGGHDTNPDNSFAGFHPLPGYAAPGDGEGPVAISDDPATWPASWPGLGPDWQGLWPGLAGPGAVAADLETFTVFDDALDSEPQLVNGAGYPWRADTTRLGAGVRVEMRTLQFDQPDYQDALIYHYTIHNDGVFTLSCRFGLLVGTLIGGRLDSNDDLVAWDQQAQVVIASDSDDVGGPGWVSLSEEQNVGRLGVAFLETPGAVGMTSLNVFLGGAVRLSNDEMLWRMMAPGTVDFVSEEPEDSDFLVGTGDYTLAPGASIELSAALFFGATKSELLQIATDLRALAANDWTP